MLENSFPPKFAVLTPQSNRKRPFCPIVQGPQFPRAVTLAVTDDEINLTIADNGLGLSPEAQEHVFDRFWRADSSRTRDQGGSGLGLAISQAIVVALNGRVSLESKPQEGAAFVVALPVNR